MKPASMPLGPLCARWPAASALCAMLAACGGGGDSDRVAEKLPHTGVTSSQCYEPGSDVLVSCSATAVTAFNAQQDGSRADINPMSYSRVGDEPLTACVKDNVTGLIWEGKEVSGSPRAGDKLYTNLGNDLANDASGHVSAVNAANLCGFSDWRMPTAAELIGLANVSSTTVPIFNAEWFINSNGVRGSDNNFYWSSEVDLGDPSRTSVVSFDYVGLGSLPSSHPFAVRLVHGAHPSAPRFTYSTASYSGDAENNVVDDAWTGLQWRRCEQGKAWSGSGCVGINRRLTHEQALAEAQAHGGWRMPNVKELSSLVDRSVGTGAKIDHTAFPGTSLLVWTSTPLPSFGSYAMSVSFSNGWIFVDPRDRTRPLRLVRINP